MKTTTECLADEEENIMTSSSSGTSTSSVGSTVTVSTVGDIVVSFDVTREISEPIVQPKGKGFAINQCYFPRKFLVDNPDFFFSPEENANYIYDTKSGVWRQVSDNNLKACFSEMFGFTLPDRLYDRTDSFLNSCVKLLKAYSERKDAFARDRGDDNLYILTADCMLRVSPSRVLAMLPHSPDFMCRTPQAIKYDPAATCPEFLASLNQQIAPADVDVLAQFFGQCLAGRNVSQTFVILSGQGGRGKSTLINILLGVLGIENAEELRMERLMSGFEESNYVGKSLIYVDEAEEDLLTGPGVAKIKALTGKSRKKTELKHASKRGATIEGCFSILIGTNYSLKIRLSGDSSAWDRRMIIMQYSAPKLVKVVRDWDDKVLRREGPGILTWMVAGLVKLRQAADSVILNEEQKDRVRKLLADSNTLENFLSDCMDKADCKDDVTSAEVYQQYIDYCIVKGFDALDESVFMKRIPASLLGMGAIKTNHVQRQVGAKMRNLNGYSRIKFHPWREELLLEQHEAEMATVDAITKRAPEVTVEAIHEPTPELAPEAITKPAVESNISVAASMSGANLMGGKGFEGGHIQATVTLSPQSPPPSALGDPDDIPF